MNLLSLYFIAYYSASFLSQQAPNGFFLPAPPFSFVDIVLVAFSRSVPFSICIYVVLPFFLPFLSPFTPCRR